MDLRRSTKLPRISGLIVALALGAPSLAAAAAAPASLTVGFIGSLTGADASLSQDQLDGFQLGFKDLGRRLAGQEAEIRVIDDHHRQDEAKQAALRLASDDHARVILLSVDAATAAALLPDAQVPGTFVIDLRAPPADMAGSHCDARFFSLSSPADSEYELLGRHLQSQGYRRLAIAGSGDASLKDAERALQIGFKGEMVEIVGHRGEMSFAGDIRRLRNAAPDATVMTYTGGMAVNFIRQYSLARLKAKIPLFASAWTLDHTTIAAAGAAAISLGSIGAWSDDIDTPSNRRLIAGFDADHGRPASLAAAVGYDAAMLIDAALRASAAKPTDDDAFRNAIGLAEFPSTRGELRFDTDQFPLQSYYLRQVVEDKTGHIVNQQKGLMQRDTRVAGAEACPLRWTPEVKAKPKK